ncbi:protein kinase domain-containing protein [Citrus sinensis]|nr:protein kinase domain-containing protein [Citrus sinensis]
MERVHSLRMMSRFLLLHCLILISLFIAAATANTSSTITDRDALLALKAHITHDPTNFLAKNWNTSTPVCNWTGVACDVHSHRVTILNISSLNLTGTIPSQLGNLSSLQSLNLSCNRLSGSIPSAIFTIYTMKYVSFRENQVSGQIPANICSNLPFLDYLSLAKNMFHGGIPSALSNCTYLQILHLSYNDFSGAVPKDIGNLSKLKELYLGRNRLQGEIPLEIGNLQNLEVLDLGQNKLIGTVPAAIFNVSTLKFIELQDNSLSGSLSSITDLSGEIPTNICSNLPFLEFLSLSPNMFHGGIPSTLSNCTYLRILSLAYNDFSGAIPREIGNLTKLKVLYIGANRLQGEIPTEISNLRNLEELDLARNKLVGIVPAAIFNVSTLQHLGLQDNSLFGCLSSIGDVRLPNLEGLYLSGNNFSGTIPRFIFNASKLFKLSLQRNSFFGFIPNTFGNLRNLKWLSLYDNYLTSSTPELSFLSSLSNSKSLTFIDLSNNPLDSVLPKTFVGNVSHSLEFFVMSYCNISGSIPEEITNLTKLTTIILGGNKLNGSIPITLSKLQKLQYLGLDDNKLEGSIPDSVCRLAELYDLELGGNKLFGSIPACFSNLASLRTLSLDSNELTSIPLTFWNLKDILYLNFSSNFLIGPLPLEVGNLKVLVGIDFSMNNFSGVIPTEIGGLQNLEYLFLGYNRLQGSIPDSFGDLISLKSLNLSNNNLSGAIPASLEKLLYLEDLNLSFNKLEGEIPRGGSFGNFSAESFEGNELLCGSPNLQVPPCKTGIHHTSSKNSLLLGIVLPLSTIFMIVVILLILRYRQRGKRPSNDANMPLVATWRMFSYLELCRATDGFSENNLIGKGGFGSVYKARLGDGMEIAVKVFNLQCGRAFKSFDIECEMMKSIRHRNLIKVISSCSNEEFKALVLEYMPHGSLEKYLYSSNCILDIFQRLNIMIDVASALEYLHFGHSAPIIHCDLKPSNVLLDDNMVGHLSDFSIAKLLTGEDQSMTHTQTLATIGYMAPGLFNINIFYFS